MFPCNDFVWAYPTNSKIYYVEFLFNFVNSSLWWFILETVTEVFLEIWQNSQESACARVSFLIKLHASALFSCEFCEVSKNTLSYITPPVAASVIYENTSLNLSLEISLYFPYFTFFFSFLRLQLLIFITVTAILWKLDSPVSKTFNPYFGHTSQCHKMFRHTLKILQHLVQDF